jgi:hypothetical protein
MRYLKEGATTPEVIPSVRASNFNISVDFSGESTGINGIQIEKFINSETSV